MKDILVTYASHYGYTARYAQWIAKQLGCEAVEVKAATARQLADCRVLVFGGGLYAGGLNGAKRIFRSLPSLESRQLVIFTCGLADPADPPTVKHIRQELEKNLPAGVWQRAKLFHFRGGMNYGRLSPIHRIMMGMLRKMLLKKPEAERTEQEQGLLATFGGTPDFTDPETARPLVEYVRAL